MKKVLQFSAVLAAMILVPQLSFASQAVAAYQQNNAGGASFQESRAAASQETPESEAEKISRELERNKELLEIWKDHVRTLTKERDEALRQIEDLKTGTAVATPAVLEEPGPSPELLELRADQDILIREKEEALLKAQKVETMQNAYDELETEFRGQQDKIKRLQAEKLEDKTKLQELKTQVLKLESGQEDEESSQAAELQGAKETIDSLEGEIENLKTENSKLKESQAALSTETQKYEEQVRALSTDLDKTLAEKEAQNRETEAANAKTLSENEALISEKNTLNGQIKTLQTQIESLEAKNRQEETTREELHATLKEKIQALKSDIDHLASENEKAEVLKTDLAKLVSENEALRKSNAELEANAAGQEQKIQEISATAAETDRLNGQLRADVKKISQQNQALQQSLTANVADIQNLKANFSSYLESLEQSFAERQNKTS